MICMSTESALALALVLAHVLALALTHVLALAHEFVMLFYRRYADQSSQEMSIHTFDKNQ